MRLDRRGAFATTGLDDIRVERALNEELDRRTIGILCQLEATAPYRRIALEWQPGYAKEGER